MALNLETKYPGKIDGSSAQYPFGQFRNITVPSDGKGTPLEKAWPNDIYGLLQALLTRAGITPSGNPDQVGASQYLDALNSEFASKKDSVQELIDNSHEVNSLVLISYYGGWAATLGGPKGGKRVHKTGATNLAPTVGAPVAISTIGHDTQAGYYWDLDGDEWKISEQILDAYMFGCKNDNTTDDIQALKDIIVYAPGKLVYFPGGAGYLCSNELTLPAGVSGPRWWGDGPEVSRIKFSHATADGLRNLGESDNTFFRGMHFESTGSSTGIGYNSRATLAATPLRDLEWFDTNVSGFKTGVSIYGGLKVWLDSGRISGRGTGDTGGVGVELGKDLTDGINGGGMRKTYISSFDICCKVGNISPGLIDGATMGPAGTATLQILNGTVFAPSLYLDGPSPVAIDLQGGYLEWSAIFSSLGAQTVQSTTPRIHRMGAGPYTKAYKSAAQSIPNNVWTIVELDAINVDLEGLWNTGTYQGTALFAGKLRINAKVFAQYQTINSEYRIGIYVNGTSVSEEYYHTRDGSVPFNLTASIDDEVFVNKGDTVAIYVFQNSGVNMPLNTGIKVTNVTITNAE